jgi:hypothetical protein
MGAIDERKALERLSQSMRRIIVGAREATRPRPPGEGQAELPAGQQPAQAAAGAPSSPAV